MMSNDKNEKTSYLIMIASLVIVGTVGVFRRYIPLSSGAIAFFRGMIGAISLFLFILLRQKNFTGIRQSFRSIGTKKLLLLILNGAFLGINWMLLFEAINCTTVAKATLCYYMQPTIVILLSPLLFKERLTAKKLACAAVALIGMVLVSGVFAGDETSATDVKGVILALSAACFYAAIVILNKKITGVDPYAKTLIQLLFAAIVLLPYLLMTGQFSRIAPDATLIVMLLVIGVVHTGLFYVMYFGSMEGLKAQSVSMLGYIDPIVAMIVSAILLGEGMAPSGLLGATMIIGASVVGELGEG